MTEEYDTAVPLESSKIGVDLDLQHRQKGLLWYSTYKVAFSGVYGFRNPSDKEQNVEFKLTFPTAQAIFDNLTFTVDGNPVALSNVQNSATAAVKVGAGKTATLAIDPTRKSRMAATVAAVKSCNAVHLRIRQLQKSTPHNTLSPRESQTQW